MVGPVWHSLSVRDIFAGSKEAKGNQRKTIESTQPQTKEKSKETKGNQRKSKENHRIQPAPNQRKSKEIKGNQRKTVEST